MLLTSPSDTWDLFLPFALSVDSDLSGYDENEAWPSLFDDFVEHENDQANQNYEGGKSHIHHQCKPSQQGDLRRSASNTDSSEEK